MDRRAGIAMTVALLACGGCSLDWDGLVGGAPGDAGPGVDSGGRRDAAVDGGGPCDDPAATAGCPDFMQITAGGQHTCGLRDSHAVTCWGDNLSGQLGIGHDDFVDPPEAALGAGVIEVVAGGNHTCALLGETGEVRCWGRNLHGQVGVAITGSEVHDPVAVVGITSAVDLDVGYEHTCVVVDGGTITCWGRNDQGEIGAPLTVPFSSMPVRVMGISGAIEVATGDDHTCARSATTVWCWGEGDDGRLGHDMRGDTVTPVQPRGLGAVQQLALGYAHSCALLEGGEVWCWGSNAMGQMGDGEGMDALAPQVVPGVSGAVQISAGSFHTCALLDDGQVQCWGSNRSGELGDRRTAESRGPELVPGVSNALEVRAGGAYLGSHTCTRHENGALRCWGLRGHGQLGDGPERLLDAPTLVADGDGERVTAGPRNSCVTGGDFKCWGSNAWHQVGSGAEMAFSRPQIRTEPRMVSQASVGVAHSCVVAEGGLWCWGGNWDGQLGQGDTVAEVAPAQVGTDTDWTWVSVGEEHTCGIKAGRVLCWGHNNFGQVGDASSEDRYAPVNSNLVETVAQVETGSDHSCVRRESDGAVYCWGRNDSGQLGVAGFTNQLNPTDTGMRGAVHLALGNRHSCAVFGDGTMRCWGSNGHRQLGDGTDMASDIPVVVMDVTDATKAAVGDDFSCALTGDGVSCWGMNDYGQLGRAGGPGDLPPARIGDLGGVVSLAAGDDHACAATGANEIYCWGVTAHGRVGDGQPALLLRPTLATALRP